MQSMATLHLERRKSSIVDAQPENRALASPAPMPRSPGSTEATDLHVAPARRGGRDRIGSPQRQNRLRNAPNVRRWNHHQIGCSCLWMIKAEYDLEPLLLRPRISTARTSKNTEIYLRIERIVKVASSLGRGSNGKFLSPPSDAREEVSSEVVPDARGRTSPQD
jgi:hypothetical protein